MELCLPGKKGDNFCIKMDQLKKQIAKWNVPAILHGKIYICIFINIPIYTYQFINLDEVTTKVPFKIETTTQKRTTKRRRTTISTTTPVNAYDDYNESYEDTDQGKIFYFVEIKNP